MSNAAENWNDEEGAGLDELIGEWEAAEQAEQAEAEKLTPDQEAAARKFAEKMNTGFLWVVQKTQCPHVDIEQLVDREAGNEALLPLAEAWGGETPPWLAALMEKYDPYIKAGWYMGMTIYTAKQAEAYVVEQAKKQQQPQGEEAGHGQESAN